MHEVRFHPVWLLRRRCWQVFPRVHGEFVAYWVEPC